MLLRWRSDILGDPQSPVAEPYSLLCEDPQAASLAILFIIACGVSKEELLSLPFNLRSVGEALSVLTVCRYFLCDRRVINFLETFLDASEWNSEDQKKILATYQDLGLYLPHETRERLGILDLEWPWKKSQPALFDELSRKELIRIWLPVLLRLEEGELLSPSRRQWRSVPDIHFTPPDDNKGTDYWRILHWTSNWRWHPWQSATRSRLLEIRAAKEAREREALAQMLYQEASENIQTYGAAKVTKFWSEVPNFEAPSLDQPLLPLFLETSALILGAVADPNNLILWDVRCPFLTNVLPVLVDADVNRTLTTETVEDFRTSFSALTMDRQEQVARKWAKTLPLTRPVGRRGLLLDRVLIDWCVRNGNAVSQ
ncbi:hypothetical protein KFL_001630150 [Klebsormidium nitens]|uniref:Uncharacterized protein n=1 Tax=Klebsormidium nitens TaxID=105231 RepID=A0A1Y1I6T9_KLENI|nr:hypothetical protein KFL_001630150 [Klebsormidium nitens]|eukprot:GAQ83818.1 hypothetical protein KFL_001630150 [Klebsormidium nitens]